MTSAMRSSGRVCVDVSGGLDSSTVACIAAAARPDLAKSGELVAFTAIASRTRASDESRYQREVLDRCGLRSIVYDMDQLLHFESIDERHIGGPSTGVFGGAGARGRDAMFAAEGLKVRLSGVGGDQVFCGSGFPPYVLQELASAWQLREWATAVAAWAAAGKYSVWRLISKYSRGQIPGIGSDVSVLRELHWYTPAWRRVLMNQQESVDCEIAPVRYKSAARRLHYRQMSSLWAFGSPRADAYSVRYPLIDRALMEFMVSVPSSQRVRPGVDRVLQRSAMQGILPDVVLRRNDKGNHTPVILKSIREHWSRLLQFAEGRRLAQRGIVDADEFAAACERLRHGLLGGPTGNEAPYLIIALSLEIWLSLYDERWSLVDASNDWVNVTVPQTTGSSKWSDDVATSVR